jgi:hypothetical protein
MKIAAPIALPSVAPPSHRASPLAQYETSFPDAPGLYVNVFPLVAYGREKFALNVLFVLHVHGSVPVQVTPGLSRSLH